MHFPPSTMVSIRRRAGRIANRAWILVLFGFILGFVAACSVGAQSGASPTATAGAANNTGSTATSTTASSTTTTSSAGVPQPDIDTLREHAVNTASPAIVKVTNVGVGLGSGVIIRADGYIVTNNHVVSGEQSLRVTLANGTTVPATLKGTDPLDDLAVVKIDRTGLPTATLGDSSALQVGQTVLAIGNPLGITRTVTDGIVSALNRTVSEGTQGGGSIPDAIQTSAPINPGNSGGALINLAGQVVGIPTLTAVDPEFNAPATGIGFAIPANTVKRIAQQIIQTGKVEHTGRAAIGICATSVDAALAAQYGLPVQHGVLVAQTVKGGAAAAAGMKANEVIIKVDQRTINNQSDLLDALAPHSPGDTVIVTAVTKSGAHRVYHLKLGELSTQNTC